MIGWTDDTNTVEIMDLERGPHDVNVLQWDFHYNVQIKVHNVESSLM